MKSKQMVLGAFALCMAAAPALAQEHGTGLAMRKLCPTSIYQPTGGVTVTCSFNIENLDTGESGVPGGHPVDNLAFTNQFPFPGGSTVGIPLTQCSASLADGRLEEPDGAANSGPDFGTCSFTELVNITCAPGTNIVTDEVRATGTDAGPGQFDGLPANQGATANIVVRCCGDGNLDSPQEACDDGNGVNEPNSDPNQCRNDCTFCGDGVEQAGEACDDGNEINGDGCDNDCTFVCSAKVDKQVSCDGVNFIDVQFNTADEDGTSQTCAGWNAFDGMPAEPITVRYVVRNTGGVILSNCTITESNAGIGGTVNVPNVPVGGDSTPIDRTPLCSDTLDDNEPDTATLNCDCGDPAIPNETATAFDMAKFQCLTPGLNVTKTCAEQEGTTNAVSIEVCNSGTADLANCTLTDTVFTEEATCSSPLEGASQNVSLTPAGPFNLDSGACQTFTGSVSGLTSDACNFASASCGIVGTSKTIDDDDADICEVPQEIICRTPGFWGTHAGVNPRKARSQDITGAFLPVTVCGITLTNTDVDEPNSAQEALCVSPRGESILQLARQLTAAALNCNASPGGCGGAVSELLADCNEVCADNAALPSADRDRTAIGDCIGDVDAFNNGIGLAPGCHDRQLPDPFQPPGPAGSSNDCNLAIDNGCTIFSCS